MFTTLRKAALIGLALTERAKEVADELAKKGEASQSEEARRVRAFFESAEKGGHEFNQKMSDLGKRIAGNVRFPSRADIDRLEKELADLAAQFRRWESSRREKGEPTA
jgi:polyhydroxyalkanoate synthesis regulator phasin